MSPGKGGNKKRNEPSIAYRERYARRAKDTREMDNDVHNDSEPGSSQQPDTDTVPPNVTTVPTGGSTLTTNTPPTTSRPPTTRSDQQNLQPETQNESDEVTLDNLPPATGDSPAASSVQIETAGTPTQSVNPPETETTETPTQAANPSNTPASVVVNIQCDTAEEATRQAQDFFLYGIVPPNQQNLSRQTANAPSEPQVTTTETQRTGTTSRSTNADQPMRFAAQFQQRMQNVNFDPRQAFQQAGSDTSQGSYEFPFNISQLFQAGVPQYPENGAPNAQDIPPPSILPPTPEGRHETNSLAPPWGSTTRGHSTLIRGRIHPFSTERRSTRHRIQNTSEAAYFAQNREDERSSTLNTSDLAHPETRVYSRYPLQPVAPPIPTQTPLQDTPLNGAFTIFCVH